MGCINWMINKLGEPRREKEIRRKEAIEDCKRILRGLKCKERKP